MDDFFWVFEWEPIVTILDDEEVILKEWRWQDQDPQDEKRGEGEKLWLYLSDLPSFQRTALISLANDIQDRCRCSLFVATENAKGEESLVLVDLNVEEVDKVIHALQEVRRDMMSP